MNNSKQNYYPVIFNIIGFQIVWFLCVFGAAHKNLLPGLVASITFSVITIFLSAQRKRDLLTLCLALPIGFMVDSLLAQSALITFTHAVPHINWAPLWIMCLWLGFALTLNHSLKAIYSNSLYLFLFGFFGAPLAYSIAAYKFGAMTFNGNVMPALLAIAFVWGFGLLALQNLNRWFSANTEIRL